MNSNQQPVNVQRLEIEAQPRHINEVQSAKQPQALNVQQILQNIPSDQIEKAE